MRIKLGLLRRIIREEVQRLVETSDVDPYASTFEAPVPGNIKRSIPMGRFDKSLVQRVLDTAEEFLPSIKSASENDDHDDAKTIYAALYEMMDRIHYAYNGINKGRENRLGTHMPRLVKNYEYFSTLDVEGAVDQTTENLIRKKIETAIVLLKQDIDRLSDVDSCGKALVGFSDEVKAAMQSLVVSNKRRSSIPPPRR